MEEIFDSIKHILSVSEESYYTSHSCRDESSTIESWKWEDIEDSEIDREKCDDREEDLPCDPCIHDIDECRAYAYRT